MQSREAPLADCKSDPGFEGATIRVDPPTASRSGLEFV